MSTENDSNMSEEENLGSETPKEVQGQNEENTLNQEEKEIQPAEENAPTPIEGAKVAEDHLDVTQETQSSDNETESIEAEEEVTTDATNPESVDKQPNTSDQPVSEESKESDTSEHHGSHLGDEDEKEDHEEDEEVDYSDFSKEQLVDEIKKLSHDDDHLLKAYSKAQKMSIVFEDIHKKEKEAALQKFIAEGGSEDDFSYKNDELTDRFEANYRLLRDKRGKFIKEREASKEQNYEKKLVVLEKIREFVDSEETNVNYHDFKELQNEWKSIGPVPTAHNKTLWANYHALLDRFYDNRSIYFELKELDRKKNLETKLELCVRAEGLGEIENLKEAITELNELHEEFKHIGPVPKEEQEALWQRFKAASDTIYKRRKAYVEDLKVELEANALKKQALVEKAEEFISFDSDRIKKWNAKTTEILQLQKEWDTIGGLPRSKAKEINKAFWKSFKQFFSNKSAFFKKLDQEREGNLEKKLEMIKEAQAMKDSEDFEKTAQQLKDLQNRWKEAGPVPEKHRESTYKEFKAACDEFFERRREKFGKSEKLYQDNLEKKEAICANIEKETGSTEASVENIKALEKEFFALGFVPKRSIRKIKDRFDKAVLGYINAIPHLDEEEKEQLVIKDEIERLTKDPAGGGNKLYRKEQDLRRKIQELENNISLWKNNLEFFASSKTADKLKDEFSEKIENAEVEMQTLKQQLRILRSAT